MDRLLVHEQPRAGFWCLHQYDVADIFDSQGNVRNQILVKLLAHEV